MKLVLSLLFAAFVGAAAANECSSGDTAYMCANLNTCWTELGFTSREELKYLCDVQGLPTEGDNGNSGGGGGGSGGAVVIVKPPRNITVPAGAVARFECTADETVRVMIVAKREAENIAAGDVGAPSSQKVIQVIDEAFDQHEGWYVCIAYGADGSYVTEEAYLEIRDICADSNCEHPKVCKPDQYTGTYECACPGDCSSDYDPVCATDCNGYFNECAMLKQTCENGLVGVKVASRGLCPFTPTAPSFLQQPQGGTYQAGSSASFLAQATGVPEDITYTFYSNGERLGEVIGANGAEVAFAQQLNRQMSGEWKVEASNCAGINKIEHRFAVTVEESEIIEPETQCCKVWGDPHVVTFDGVRFDYMGSCSYMIAQDDVKGEWMIYGTYKPCGDKTKQLSCIVSITAFMGSEMVQFLRMYRVNYRGEEFMVGKGQERTVGNIRIVNENMKYFIYLGDTGVRVMWDGITTSETCLPKKCGGGVSGMCGNADCDDTNEYEGFQSYSAFANSWAVGPKHLCDLEPEDGMLPVERTRPCDFVDAGLLAQYEADCNAVLDYGGFANCIYAMGGDRAALYANCMFDSCAGLTLGGGCDGDKDGECSAEIEAKIQAAVLAGMTAEEAAAKYKPAAPLTSACATGITLMNDCAGWNIFVDNGWRTEMNCPSDAQIEDIRVCP